MSLKKVLPSEICAFIGGLVLLGSLWLNWYNVGSSGTQINAWEAFGATDIVLAIVAVLALTPAVLSAAQPSPALPVAADVFAFLGCLTGVGMIVIRIFNEPVIDGTPTTATAGIYVALVGALVILGGSGQAMRSEKLQPGVPTDNLGEVRQAPHP